MDTRKVRILFLAFYVLSLIVWIAEEIFTLTNPPEYFDRFRIIIATVESFIALSSFLVVFILYKELKAEAVENVQAKSQIHDLKRTNRILKNPELGFWAEAKAQMEEWKLSEAETEIAILLLRGFSQKQIAAVRKKSLRTIENQTAAIYEKSSMRGKLEFISYFLTPLLPEED
ncbi:helix-turn-helix transcriptional regulator [Leptospira perdikensis]|uniref:Response regulator n=1 Tax=Leptospira perdikensis TaxID=2484948 RepID=A0A4R9JLK1_9LEPT|nr:response regulator [Leptospira perdikensis]TGL44792.1 response regulator [Leptospira perdikensis]